MGSRYKTIHGDQIHSFKLIQFALLLYILLTSKGCFSRPLEDEDIVDEDLDETINNDDEYSFDDSFAQPVNLEALSFTQDSITLKWDLKDADPSDVDSYRIFYTHHNFNDPDIKTIREQEPMHVLNGLEPYTQYEIKVVSIIKNGTDSSESQPSEPIVAQTDVAQPSAPIITNASCWSTGSLYLEWKKPERYSRSIDFYTIYYKQAKGQNEFKEYTTIQNNENVTIQRFNIENLIGNRNYVIKIRAGTKSLSRQDYLKGDPSEEKTVFLPLEDCLISSTSFSEGILGQAELSAGMIVGAVCAVLFLLLAVIGYVIWRQYFKAAYYYLDEPHRIAPPTKEPVKWEDFPGPEGGNESGAICVQSFVDHVTKMHADSDAGFAKEYSEIQKLSYNKFTSDQSSHPDNKCKNRYLNIVAYDHSRVRLMPIAGQKKTSDYINGNFIDGFQKINAYIGTQGPLIDTCEAFWRMVWEQNVYVVVMITNLLERGRRKCDLYWPKAKEETETYGFVEVTLESEEVMANYTVRTMKIKHLKDVNGEWVANVSTLRKKKGMTSEREIKQYHYTSWPDHGVPCHPLPVLSFIRKSANANPPDGGPIVVHCSAGVGRTGTYIAIDSLLQQARVKNEFNVFGYLNHIRTQRNHLVQTEEQYVFIHDALLEAIRSSVTEISRENVANYVEESLLKPATSGDFAAMEFEENDLLLDAQFRLVTAFQPSEYQYMSANMECNLEKNRDAVLIPLESTRIPLAPKPGVEGSDYINASWLHGHEKLKEFIITQHPTLLVKDDFWRMLWDHNAQTVVLLSPLEEDDFPVFWPLRNSDFELETFRVRFVDEAVHEGHSTLDFVVSSQHDDYELAVRIIHCPDWSHSISKVQQCFNVLKLVQDWHLEYQDGPLVVVDKIGGTSAATFCALTTLCKQLETYNGIDVYQVAKLYHNKRPGIWRSSEDVLYLYKAMEILIASNQINPLQPIDKVTVDNVGGGGASGTATTSVVTDAGQGNSRTSSSGQSSLVPPERRHSTSASDWSQSGVLVKKNSVGISLSNGSGHSRRHSLPNGNGCIVVPLKETNTTTTNTTTASSRHEDEDEDIDEEISETAALTAV